MKATLTVDGKEFDVVVTAFEFMTNTLPSATFVVKSNTEEFEKLALKHMTIFGGRIACND